jgi:hypothetical protein
MSSLPMTALVPLWLHGDRGSDFLHGLTPEHRKGTDSLNNYSDKSRNEKHDAGEEVQLPRGIVGRRSLPEPKHNGPSGDQPQRHIVSGNDRACDSPRGRRAGG